MFVFIKCGCFLISSYLVLHLVNGDLQNKIEKRISIIDKTGKNTCNEQNDCILYPNGNLKIEFNLKVDIQIIGLTLDAVLTHGEKLEKKTKLNPSTYNACYDAKNKQVTLATGKCASNTIPPREKAYKVTFTVFCPTFEEGAILDLKTNKEGISGFRALWAW